MTRNVSSPLIFLSHTEGPYPNTVPVDSGRYEKSHFLLPEGDALLPPCFFVMNMFRMTLVTHEMSPFSVSSALFRNSSA